MDCLCNFQFHSRWPPTVTEPFDRSKDGKLRTNLTPTSTESTRPDPSERSYNDREAAIDFDLLLETLAGQLKEYEGDIPTSVAVSSSPDDSFAVCPSSGTLKAEECVDIKPLLTFDSSDESLVHDVGKIDSTYDTVEKANYFMLNKVERYDDTITNSNNCKNTNNKKHNNNNTYYCNTPETMSAAQSPSATDAMDEEFFVTDVYQQQQQQTIDFTFSNNDMLIDYNDVIINDDGVVMCEDRVNVKEEVVYDTPEVSPGGFNAAINRAIKRNVLPKMDLSKIQIFGQDENIRTPDIINSIIEYEKNDLGQQDDSERKVVTLTNFVAEETVPSVSSSPFFDPSSSLAYLNSPSSGVPSPASIIKPSSSSGRKRYADDSDEDFADDAKDADYVPYEDSKRTHGKGGVGSRTAGTMAVGSKRGRPPKRVKSISSDDYSQLDPEEAKYREMRDRNNEASRRSRYKRKQKEMKIVDELAVEEERNVKLKAEVEELQKTVDRFRDSLMKVMLSKR